MWYKNLFKSLEFYPLARIIMVKSYEIRWKFISFKPFENLSSPKIKWVFNRRGILFSSLPHWMNPMHTYGYSQPQRFICILIRQREISQNEGQ